ncbi:MAG: dihydrodipicolinate synthase family protein [Armatimonadota bacterium]
MDRPPLWCPLLTRHTAGGSIDAEAMRRHAATLRPHVDGLLMPGSTGDGWQLDDAQTDTVTRLGAELSREHGFALLAGAFAPSLEGILARADRVLAAGAPGIAVCAPHGDRSPSEIEDALEHVLALGHPTALYQLPQITGNRIAPDSAAALAKRHQNLKWFKDSSGEDTVAVSGLLPPTVVLVRGAEGDYARWLAPQGPYHGFLLSTANCFPEALRAVVDDPVGRADLSNALSAVVAEAFAAVAGFPHSNAFANANKALDHALRARATRTEPAPPIVHGGASLPVDALRRVAVALARFPIQP